MDAWIIGLVAGGVLFLVLVGVLRVVVKAAATTAETARAVLVALEDIKASTAPLAQLRRLDPEAVAPESEAGPTGNGARAEPGTGAEEQRGTQG